MLLANWLADRAVDINEMGRHSLAWSEMSPAIWRIATGQDNPTQEDIDTYRPYVHAILADRRLRETMHPNLTLGSGDDVFVKTHSLVGEIDGHPTINPEVTKGAVYIVRDPRDVCVSYAAHYGISHDHAVDQMRDGTAIGNEGHEAYQYIGPWSDHVSSWLDIGGDRARFRKVVLKYENLRSNPARGLLDLVKTFDLPTNGGRINRAARNSAFSRMQEQEAKHGFVEKVRGPFFRKGQAGGWRQVLTERQVLRIEFDHGHVMDRMGYQRMGQIRAA